MYKKTLSLLMRIASAARFAEVWVIVPVLSRMRLLPRKWVPKFRNHQRE